jgi:hypothetical protein
VSRAIPVRQATSPPRPSGFSHPAIRDQLTAFEYVGKTALTAIGPISGRHYRFSYPGAIVEVDSRDGPSLATVPNLRKRLRS